MDGRGSIASGIEQRADIKEGLNGIAAACQRLDVATL